MTYDDTIIRLEVAARMGVHHAHAIEADRQDARAMGDCESMREDGYTPRERLDAWEPR